MNITASYENSCGAVLNNNKKVEINYESYQKK